MDFMKQLRYGRFWIAIAWFGVALLIYLSLAKLNVTVDVANGDKYGHVAAYAVLTFWFMQLYEDARSRLFVVSGLFALGVLLEILQFLTGYRSMDAVDAAADALGIALGWLAAPPRTTNVLERVERR
jgi:VanZ family protein